MKMDCTIFYCIHKFKIKVPTNYMLDVTCTSMSQYLNVLYTRAIIYIIRQKHKKRPNKTKSVLLFRKKIIGVKI